MSRYVLVEVESPEEAERLMQLCDNSRRQFPTSRVVGLFTKATQLCTCAPWAERYPGVEERSMKGPKYGWWVCPDCRLPKRMGGQYLANLLDGGKMHGGGWRDILGRRLGWLSVTLSVRWVEHNGRVTAFRAEVRDETSELEIMPGSDK